MATTDRIEVNPKITLGRPVIRGTRITVELIVRKIAEGASEADLLDAYPTLKPEDIRAARAFAADSLSHDETIILDPAEPAHGSPGRFLADESCDSAVVHALEAAGHDGRGIAPKTRSPQLLTL